MTAGLRLLLLVTLMAVVSACMPTRQSIRQAQQDVHELQDTRLSCDLPDHCALDSNLYRLGRRALDKSTTDAPYHELLLLENGQDALIARINLIRAARERIDVQSYIYAEDDAGFLILQELLAAARRGAQAGS